MEDATKDNALRAMQKRINEGPYPFTFQDLHFAGDKAVGLMPNSGFSYRIADRLIQRERKAGRIKQVARGKWALA